MLTTQTEINANWTNQLQTQTFTWAAFQFIMKAREHSFLPEYKGSTLRGGFGHSFRRVCCTIRDQECNTCKLNQSCPYAYIFETLKVNGMVVQHQADNLPTRSLLSRRHRSRPNFRRAMSLRLGWCYSAKASRFCPILSILSTREAEWDWAWEKHNFWTGEVCRGAWGVVRTE